MQNGNSASTPTPSSDPLSSLYRMSKTAGLATSNYKSVNVCSVVSLVAGLLSTVAQFDAVLLIIPLAGLILGIIALKQILGSSGTQAGLPLAALGIILSLAFGVWAATGSYREAARTAADRTALTKIVNDFSAAVRENRLSDAYALTSPTFQQRVDRKQFDEFFNFYRKSAPLKALDTNGLFAFDSDPQSGISIASGQLIMSFESGTTAPDRPQIIFSSRAGQWKIEGLPSFFVAPSPAPAR